MRKALAILLLLSAVAVWRHGLKRNDTPGESLATISSSLFPQTESGMNCTETSCEPQSKVIIIPIDTSGNWQKFHETFRRAIPSAPKGTACCIGSSEQGNLSICPVSLQTLSALPFDETYTLLLVHFSENGITTCRAAISRNEQGEGEPAPHLATCQTHPQNNLEATLEEIDDWLGFRPEKHVLLFSMSNACPLAEHLPHLRAIFRSCERLGSENPQFRLLNAHPVLLNRGNTIILHEDLTTFLHDNQRKEQRNK